MTGCHCGWVRGEVNDAGSHQMHMSHLVEAERQKQIAAGYPQPALVAPVTDPAHAGPRDLGTDPTVTVWMGRDPFHKYLTLSTVPFTRDLLPAGPDGDGWTFRRLDLDGDAWRRHLRGGDHTTEAEVRAHRLAWWDAATPESED